MQLHLSRDPGVVSLVEHHTPVPPVIPRSHLVCHRIAPALVEDRRVCHPEHLDVIPDLLLFPLQDPVRDLHRGQLYADIRHPGLAPVPLPVPVQTAIRPHRKPSAGKRLRVPVVKPEVPRPVRRNLERLHHMRPQAILVVRRVIPPLLEHLPLEAVPVSVQQRRPQRRRLLLQLENVVIRDKRILHRQRRNVLRPDLLRLVQGLRIDLLRLDAHVRPRVHEHFFHPAVPDVTGVAGTPDNGHNAQALLRPQTGLDEIVDHLLKRSQLVKIQELDLNT